MTAQLPGPWLEAMRVQGGRLVKQEIDRDGAREIVAVMPEGEPCRHVLAAAGAAMTAGAVHENFRPAVLSVLGAGRGGCPGAAAVLVGMRRAFLAGKTYGPEGRGQAESESEWGRLLDGGVALVAAHDQGTMCVDRQLDWIDKVDSTELEEVTMFDRAVLRRVMELQIIDAAKEAHDLARLGQVQPGRLVTLAEFLAEPDQEEDYIVPGLWPTDGRVLLVAAAKTGKTTTVVGNLLPALVDGGLFFGRYPVQPVTGVVGYLNLEVSERTMRAWCRRAGIVAKDRVALMNLRGMTSAVTIGTAKGRAQFAAQLRDAGITCLIADPAAPLLASLGFDENSNTDVARFFDHWSETMRLAGVSSDLLAHHTGHAGERSRGASRLLDEPDSIWSLTKDKAAEDGEDAGTASALRYFSAYGRDVDHPVEALNFDPGTGALTLTGNSKGAARLDRGSIKVNELMADLIPRSKNEIYRGLGGDRSGAYRIVEHMIDTGALIDTGLKVKGYPRWALGGAK